MSRRIPRSVSVPEELLARMERFKDQNWSAIAEEAFKDQLAYLERAALAPDAEAQIVARYAESKLKLEQWLFRDGQREGLDYVNTRGTYYEMDRLRRWRQRLGSDDLHSGSWPHFDIIAVIMSDAADDNAVEEYKEMFREYRCSGGDPDNALWMRGWITGAITQFERISKYVETPTPNPTAPTQ